MKNSLAFLAAFVVFLVPANSADKNYKLHEGIATFAQTLSAKLPAGTKTVIFDIKSDNPDASSYIIEELTYELLEIGSLVVVDRQSLEAIRSELSLQTSGDVSDESAQRLGAILGAQTLLSGSFELRSDVYRFAVKAVKVETSEIQYINSLSILNNSETEVLFGKKTSTPIVVENTGATVSAPSKTTTAVASVGKAIRGVADFTGRFICMTVNPAFGLGSFMQGDMHGGGKVVFWEIVGIAALAGSSYMRDDADYSTGEVALVAGIGGVSLGGAIIYSLIRPWTYNRAPSIVQAFDGFRITVTAEDKVSIGYTVKY